MFYILHGGRGSAKSWSVGTFLLLEGRYTRHRILCGREIQNSIKESVKKLLIDGFVIDKDNVDQYVE